MTLSAVCQVKDGGGAYSPTPNGVNVTPGDTITIDLVSKSVAQWTIAAIGTDETQVASAINAGLTIDSLNKRATYTAPAAGTCLLFQSTVTDNNGNTDAQTFAVFTLTAGGNRVGAVGMTVEASSAYGWVPIMNSGARLSGGASPAGSNGDIQKKNGTSLAASGLNDDGTKITTTRPFFGGASVCTWDSDGTTCFFGKDRASGNQHTNAGIYATSSCALGIGTNPYVIAANGVTQVGFPLVGYTGGNSPYGAVDGEAVIAMSGSTHALTSSEYIYGNVRVTGTGTNILQFPLGGSGSGAYVRFVHNAGTGTLAVKDTANNAAAATLATGTGAWFKFYNDGAQKVKQLTAAFTVA